jgi:hypothetical protein
MPILRSRRTSRPTTSRERRQSPRLTKRELRQSLSGPARKWVKGVWEAAERFSDRLERLSPVTSPVGTALIDQYIASHKLEGEELQRALFLTLLAGYSTRAVLAGPTEQPGLKPRSIRVDELEDRVRTIATDEFDSVMTLPSEVWAGYVATATMKQQQRFASKTLPWYGLGRERVETLLRWGYVLCCVDEALDCEPVLQDAAQ